MSKPPPSERSIDAFLSSHAPISLPPSAWAPDPLEWLAEPAPAWMWISWPHRATERLPGYVLATTRRVCVVAVATGPGQRWEPVVWRNAVTRRIIAPDGDA